MVLLQNGTLKITDRKKHIFKLAQGEYIAPEKIECVYSLSDPVAQIFVHGDSLQVSNLYCYNAQFLVCCNLCGSDLHAIRVVFLRHA